MSVCLAFYGQLSEHHRSAHGGAGIPNNWYQSIWFKVVYDFCSKEAKHTETQYLTWFGKTAYIHGRESILFRDRERITTQYMEEEDHFTQTQLPALFAALAAAAMAARLLPLQLSLSLYSLAQTHHTLFSLILLSHVCL